jgi:putative Holliday junction resolvase
MAICKIEDLAGGAAGLPAYARLAGFDIGDRIVGLAISDGLWTVASPLGGIPRQKRFADTAGRIWAALDAAGGVGGLVFGLPVNMDGTEGPRCRTARQFADNLLAVRDLPAVFWDERLSTQAVERAMLEADLSRARRARRIDAAAAAYILQGALDRLDRLKTAGAAPP